MVNGSSSPEPKLEAPSSSLDLEQMWYIVREKAWLILLFGLLGILGGLWYIHKTPLTYYAQAVIEVDPEPIKVIGYEEAVQQTKDPISEDMAQTLKAVFHSREFASEVIKDYDLLDYPNFIPHQNGKPVSLDDATGGLIGMEQINLPPETRFINVGIIHSDQQMAKELADIVANHYCQRALREQEDRAKTANDYLRKVADEASETLTLSETALNNYIRDTKAVSLVDSHDTVVSDLRSKTTNLDQANSELLQLQADDKLAAQYAGNETALLTIPSVTNDPEINADQQVINDLQEKIQVLKLRYYDPHPKMIEAHRQLADAESKLETDVLNIPEQIHAKRTAAEVRVADFDKAVHEQEGRAVDLDFSRIKYDVLQRKVDSDKALYQGILDRLKDSQVANGLESNGMHIFEPAQLPMEPVQARKSKTLCISLIGGLMAGFVLAFGLHMMDSSLKSVDQAEDILGLTVLASIPRQPQSKLKDSSMALVKAPGSPVAEAFRSLRTSIYLAGKAKGRKIILFTSTLAGEGKTFCSTNYATALAQQGLKTLLVDADLRSPMIASVLLPDRKVPGLGELLSRKVDEASIHESEIENLYILPAGDLLPNPAEMLARSEMGEIVRQLSEKFDRIVIDTAPVTAVSDTLLLLEHAEVICLVAHVGRTPRKWLLRAMKLIAEAGSRPTGVILNQMPIRMAGAYSYYPGKYGEPEVYGSRNGTYGKGGRKDKPEELVESEPRV